jgi:hypothetical protein
MQRAKQRTNQRNRRNERFFLERLEQRNLLACQIIEQDQVLRILGDNKANTVVIYDREYSSGFGGPGYVEVVCDGRNYTPKGPIRDIIVDLGNGNDSLTYVLGDTAQAPDLVNLPVRNLIVNMGNGADRVYGKIEGFATADPTLPALGPGTWRLQFGMGSGNDRFAFDLAADLLGDDSGTEVKACDLVIDVKGGAGNDYLDVLIPSPIFISQSYLDVLLFGEDGNDILEVGTTDDRVTIMNATVVVERHGGRGNDGFYGQILTLAVENTIFDQVIDGGPGADTIRIKLGQRSRARL